MPFLIRTAHEDPAQRVALDTIEASTLADAIADSVTRHRLAQYGEGLELLEDGSESVLARSWFHIGYGGWTVLTPDEVDVSRPDIAPIDEIEI